MKKPFTFLLCTALLLCSSCKNEAVSEYFPNLYWPGDFEEGLYGGNFSKGLNVLLTDSVNATPGGQNSWYLPPKTYQHLELLTEGNGDFRLSFKGKASGEMKLFIKVAYRDDLDSTRTNDKTVIFPGDNTWHDYIVDFTVDKPFPGPRTGEFLISCYNPGVHAWIDDVDLRRTSPDTQSSYFDVDPALVTNHIRNGNFSDGFGFWIPQKNEIVSLSGKPNTSAKNREVPLGSKVKAGTTDLGALRNVDINAYLRLGLTEEAVYSIRQSISAEDIAGKHIRISADIAFETIDEEEASSWAGILLVLRNGNNINGEVIQSEPMPNWYPLGLASPPGQFKKIHATYKVPDDARVINLTIQAMEKIASNTAMVDNVILEVLD